MNSRIKDFYDFIPNDDLDFIFNNVAYPSDNFEMPRKSKDKSYNSFGMSFIDVCCTFDIHVLNGRLFGDKNGEFTCFANGGASVVDYMISSSAIFDHISNFGVGDCMFSVHCPMYCNFTFKCNANENDDGQSDKGPNDFEKFVWKE